MAFNAMFRKPKNELEKGGRPPEKRVESDVEMAQSCPICGKANPISELWETLFVCRCGHCFRLTARQRIGYLTDKDSFCELFTGIESADPIGFPGYTEKLEQSREIAREMEAVVCGRASIEGEGCALFVMEPYFMMGDRKSVV